MYSIGAIYLPEEVIRRVTCELPDPQYFAHYLKAKFEAIYDLPGTV
jgi:Zn-dependent M32 family carboxypeptidase